MSIAGTWASASFATYPEGGGAYHWITDSDDSARWFVTCDDLDTKPWLGRDRDTVFERLLGAYRAAMDLRASGLAFVIPPLANVSGAPAVRVDDRYSLSLFEYVDGEPQRWGRPLTHDVVGNVLPMLAALHRSTPVVRGTPRRELDVPCRADLERMLAELDRPWDGGPLSDASPTRTRGAQRAGRRLAGATRPVRRLPDPGGRHARRAASGQPHLDVDEDLRLIDWDTVALAEPEHDLWMLDDCK